MSKQLLPSEIQVWYVLPVLRKQLAKALIDKYSCSQRKAAELLGITEAAVSQYLKDKRGNDITLPKNIYKEIEQAAKQLIEEKSDFLEESMKLLQHKLISQVICEYHKEHDSSVKKDCTICFQAGVMK